MTEALVFIILGMVFLAIFLATLLLSEQPERSLATDNRQEKETPAILTSLNLDIPSRHLADRIFAQDDLDFVLREPPSLSRLFLQERRKIALAWLNDTRDCVRRIFQFYRIAVRSNAALEFRTELSIAQNYFLFLCVISCLLVLINLLGTFRVRGIVVRMFVLTDQISTGVERTLTALTPPSLVKLKNDWARQANPAD